MSDGILPIPAYEPVGQVGRTGKFGERESKRELFERHLDEHENAGATPDPAPGKDERDTAKQERRRKADPDGTGRTLNVTA